MNTYARITTEDGDFNEVCDVSAAGAMVAFGMITYDGEASPGEHCYTVTDEGTAAVLKFIADGRWNEPDDPAAMAREIGNPGYPGPCPEGMDWSEWLAMNNVD
jgi:hypothetical protein